MSARRKSNGANFRGVYVHFQGILSDCIDCVLNVFNHCGVVESVTTYTISKHKSSDALFLKPLCHLVPFVFHAKMMITSTGTDNYRRCCCCLLRSSMLNERLCSR